MTTGSSAARCAGSHWMIAWLLSTILHVVLNALTSDSHSLLHADKSERVLLNSKPKHTVWMLLAFAMSACAIGLVSQNLQCSAICPKLQMLISNFPDTNAARIQLETNEWVRGSAQLAPGLARRPIISNLLPQDIVRVLALCITLNNLRSLPPGQIVLVTCGFWGVAHDTKVAGVRAVLNYSEPALTDAPWKII